MLQTKIFAACRRQIELDIVPMENHAPTSLPPSKLHSCSQHLFIRSNLAHLEEAERPGLLAFVPVLPLEP